MPGYKTEATVFAFHLRNKSGIRNTEELEQDSAGCCGESWTDIWDRLFLCVLLLNLTCSAGK